MLKTFNCLGLDILALGYSSHFFLIDFVDCRHFTQMRPIKEKFSSKSKVFSIDYPSNFNNLTDIKTIKELC